MTAPLDLTPIRERAAKATEGPWEWTPEDASMVTLHGPSFFDHHVVCLTICDSCRSGHEQWAWGRCYTAKAPDAAFIAHAREDVPALIEEVEKMRAALRKIASHELMFLTGAGAIVANQMAAEARAALGDAP